jgi:hypothetical protein
MLAITTLVYCSNKIKVSSAPKIKGKKKMRKEQLICTEKTIIDKMMSGILCGVRIKSPSK